MMSDNLRKHRFLEGFLPAVGKRRQLVILTGARQTGKTTLAKSRYPDLRYINFDSPENRETLRAISSQVWGRDVGNVILDEAQKEPLVFEKVKYAYDEEAIDFTLILGSSQILLLKKIRESLSGRVSIYELWPLLLSEVYWDATAKNTEPPLLDRLFLGNDFEKTLEEVPSVLVPEEDIRRCEAESYLLQWGGMPSLLPLNHEERWKWLKDYEYTYLERDLSDIARLDDLEPFRKFQKLSALRSGQLLNYSELARDASVSVDTARRYLEYLKVSYQVLLVQPYHRNITSSVVKTPKLYWLDIGLLRQLSGYRGEFQGELYETMVVSEIIKWIKTVQRTVDIYFYRTHSGLELDLFLQTETGMIGMEIKSRKTVVPSDLRAMKDVAAGLGKAWRGGLVIYQGNKIERIAHPNIWIIPSRRLLI